MTGSGRYKAFISYAHSDRAWAHRLHRKLENFRSPSNHDLRWPLRPVFLDRTELASSPDLSNSIQTALTDSDALIVICSPAAAASRWVNDEILFFKRQGKSAIFPIIVAGEPDSDKPGIACFPESLRYRLDTTGKLSTEAVEPLAADWRRDNDGSDAVLKLIAGLLKVPFDSLKLRQQRRRMRQAIGIATGALAIMVMTTTLAITAILARQDAERRRDQAENLISFMLGDLRNRLQPVGRLDVLDGVGEQALAYFSSLTDADVTDESLLTRATALRQIGEVRVAQGMIDEGLVAFNEALELLNNSTAQREDIRLFELGQINYWIADAYFNQLELEQAQIYIVRYLEISRQLVAIAPDNTDYRLELLYAESNLGTLALRAAQYDLARDHFNNALTITRALEPELSPEEFSLQLASTLTWLANVEEMVGDLHAANTLYFEQVSLRKELAVSGNDPRRQHELARSLYVYAKSLGDSGDPVSSANHLADAVQLYRTLVAYDPLNFDWQREMAWSMMLLARNSYIAGLMDTRQTAIILELAQDTMASITEDVTAETARTDAAIKSELARLALSDGDHDEALRLSRVAIRVLSNYLSSTDRARILPVYAQSAYFLSEALLAAGQTDEARSVADAGLSALAARQTDPVEIQAYASLLGFISGDESANQLLSRVAATDFRAAVPIQGTRAGQWWTDNLP